MKKNILISIGLSFLLFQGCTPKSYHNEMLEKQKEALNKDDFNQIKDSYSESLIDTKTVKQKYVSILEDKSLSDVLKELENIDGKIYFLKSSDILIPKSRLKIKNFNDLNNYLNAVLDKTLVLEKSSSLNLVSILSTSESKKLSINNKKFNLDGQLSVEELLKLITKTTSYQVNIGSYIENRNDFQNSIITIKSNILKDALNQLASAKNVYVDIDYEKESINISRYKDVVIELNIPLLDMSSSSKTSNQENTGESKIENKQQIVLYEELDKMLKNIISNDKISTYHIDKASGLVFLKSTKNIESAVRTLAKAYEASFAKEAIIEFERIELILNKDRKFGILGANFASIDGGRGTGANIGNIVPEMTSDIAINSITRNLQVLAQSNNNIGRVLNYSKNMLILKNNLPTVQAITENTDYVEKIEVTIDTDTKVRTSDVTVNTIKEGTSITALAKISRDKIFLNINPSIKKLLALDEKTIDGSTIQLPKYNDQGYNVSKEIRLGETSIVGSIIVHDDAKEYQGIIPIDGFAVGGSDSKSYIRREIVYVVTLREIKGF
ncbi:hypothetical protein [Aliarcobacter thereius]|uniref:Type II and III secretion system protein n=2 Tax=Aliarcobacter thereius TaxID=544718 RepID=A0A5R9GXK1_9BACT|nr:hypothetical protein [Aliarcobacter thereius]OCL95843.1 hypothetical protein AA347_01325 [Aliarcobacter thereius LMG 24486]QBF16184.1 hypothetical protein ATH_1126 [Aliarcobacter thereius LMG 24486]TLS70971.1 hypothetical protein FE246_08370 [Aliarcobacter thereius]TLS92189.1 hypothetical protein FE244_07250 [Aliarcobacter thereius]